MNAINTLKVSLQLELPTVNLRPWSEKTKDKESQGVVVTQSEGDLTEILTGGSPPNEIGSISVL